MKLQDKLNTENMIRKTVKELPSLLRKDSSKDMVSLNNKKCNKKSKENMNRQTDYLQNINDSLNSLPKILQMQNRTFYYETSTFNMDSNKNIENMSYMKNEFSNISNFNSIIKSSESLIHKINNKKLCLIDQRPSKTQKKPFYKRIYKNNKILPKEQRFFQNKPYVLSTQKVKQLGYYQASNIYKPTNVKMQLGKQCMITSKYPNYELKSILKGNDFFLTNVKKEEMMFRINQFIDQELDKEQEYQKIKTQSQQGCVQNQQIQEENVLCSDQQTNLQENQQNNQVKLLQNSLYLTINDYQFVKNQEFKYFKTKNLQNWGQVLNNFSSICKCLKMHKITYFKVKDEHLLKWSGVKNSIYQVNKDLFHYILSCEQKIYNCCVAFFDRMRVRKMRENARKKENLARWAWLRLKMRTEIRKAMRQKLQKGLKLHKNLLKHMDWDIQIHLCSFSVQPQKRNTSLFVTSFENIYHEVWSNTSKEIILIIPTLNENILKLLQSKLKLRKNITIICPEVFDVFPANLCLTAQVLYSFQTIKKLRNIIRDKKAVIMPGCVQNNRYELLLSEHLNAPLLCSLNIDNTFENQKKFFKAAEILTAKHIIIQPKSSYQLILQRLSQLILENSHSKKKWLFKINKEFNSRGIAYLELNPSKYIKVQNTYHKNKNIIYDYLIQFFKLKLKVCNENSLYSVQSYMKQFQKLGGIIQEDLNCQYIYEVILKKYQSCEFQYVYKVYNYNYSNKVWISCQPSLQLLTHINKFQQIIDNDEYYGTISVSLCKVSQDEYLGMELKLNQTYSSSAISFVKMIQQKRSSTVHSAINIDAVPTKRRCLTFNQESNLNLQLCFNDYKYLIVPNLIFKDVDQEIKAEIIQKLMDRCWNDKSLRINEECKLYMSMGVDLSMILIGKDMKRLKKQVIQALKELNEISQQYRVLRAKEPVRDVFHYDDIVRAVNKIASQQS